MDYRDHDDNGEGLFGARNENSVLFSLDSLNSLDRDSGGNGDTSGLSTSGDASGLIDLNTLSRMSNSPSSGEDGMGDGVIMESMVFNQVVTKKSKKIKFAIVAGFIGVIALAAGISWFFYNKVSQEKELQAAEMEAQAEAKQKEAAELQERIEQLEREKKAAELEGQRRTAKQEEIDKELARLKDAQMNAQIAAGGDATGSGSGKSGKKSSGGGGGAKPSGGDAAPAPAPTKKAPDKAAVMEALKAANQKAAKCGKNGSLTVQFNLTNNQAKGVKAVGGSFAGSATERCILTVVEKHNWPDGTAQGIKFTFKL